MKVFIAILAACLVLSGAQAAGTVTNPGEKIIEYIYSVVQNDMSGDQPSEKVINPSLIADEAACYVQYENMAITVLKLGVQSIMQCYEVSTNQIKAVAESKMGSMMLAKYKSNLQGCSGVDSLGSRLECVADMTEKFLKEINVLTMPIQMETKLCQRYEVHNVEAAFYKSHMELEKCLARVKINAQIAGMPPMPQLPNAPFQNVKGQLQNIKAQRQQQQQ